MKKKLIVSAAAILLTLTGCAGNSEPETTTVPGVEDYTMSNDVALSLLQVQWDNFSGEQQESVCYLFNMDRDAAWMAFNDGAKDAFPKNVFLVFFNTHC